VTAKAAAIYPADQPTNGFVTTVINFWVEQQKNFYNQLNNHHVLKECLQVTRHVKVDDLFNDSQVQLQQFASAHRKSSCSQQQTS
jgi:hypothetical protein